jgi:hypothetical protein
MITLDGNGPSIRLEAIGIQASVQAVRFRLAMRGTAGNVIGEPAACMRGEFEEIEGLCGYMSFATHGNGHMYNMSVAVSNACSGSATQNQALACHEVGHATGLDHAGFTGTCMHEEWWNSAYPHSWDFDWLFVIYDH